MLVWLLSEVGLFATVESVELVEALDVNNVKDVKDVKEVDVQKSIVLSGLSLVVLVETCTLRLSGKVPMYIVLAVLAVLVDIVELVELTVSCLEV